MLRCQRVEIESTIICSVPSPAMSLLIKQANPGKQAALCCALPCVSVSGVWTPRTLVGDTGGCKGRNSPAPWAPRTAGLCLGSTGHLLTKKKRRDVLLTAFAWRKLNSNKDKAALTGGLNWSQREFGMDPEPGSMLKPHCDSSFAAFMGAGEGNNLVFS